MHPEKNALTSLLHGGITFLSSPLKSFFCACLNGILEFMVKREEDPKIAFSIIMIEINHGHAGRRLKWELCYQNEENDPFTTPDFVRKKVFWRIWIPVKRKGGAKWLAHTERRKRTPNFFLFLRALKGPFPVLSWLLSGDQKVDPQKIRSVEWTWVAPKYRFKLEQKWLLRYIQHTWPKS